jgi:hypothetical protein
MYISYSFFWSVMVTTLLPSTSRRKVSFVSILFVYCCNAYVTITLGYFHPRSQEETLQNCYLLIVLKVTWGRRKSWNVVCLTICLGILFVYYPWDSVYIKRSKEPSKGLFLWEVPSILFIQCLSPQSTKFSQVLPGGVPLPAGERWPRDTVSQEFQQFLSAAWLAWRSLETVRFCSRLQGQN